MSNVKAVVRRFFLWVLVMTVCACADQKVRRSIVDTNDLKGPGKIEARLRGPLCYLVKWPEQYDLANSPEQLVAIPINKSCSNLELRRDFFDRDVYGNDNDFVPALERLAIALRDARSGNRDLIAHHVKDDAVKELLQVQMAGLKYMRLSSNSDFEFEFGFTLSNVKLVALLSKKGKVEFVRAIE